jgi:cytochrome c553
MSSSRLVLLAIFTSAIPVRAEDDKAFEMKFRAFAGAHCADCHGPDVTKAGLRLDTLPATFDESAIAAKWTKVLDKMTKGEMPPKKQERPPEKEKREITVALQGKLHDSSLALQQLEGRVAIRRLNRNEYETTLRDLLGVKVNVKELLPEDGSVAGFDNVGSALDVSSTHLLRYQEAAEKALLETIPNRPLEPSTIERRTGKQITEKRPTFKELMGKSVRLDGDSLIMFVKTWDHITCESSIVPQTGRYRVRASLKTIGNDGKPLPVQIEAHDQYRSEPRRNDLEEMHRRIIRDVPEGKPTIIELELDLKQRNLVSFRAFTLPNPRDFEPIIKRMPLEKYAGPGLVVEWVEIEGPLGVWPPANYQRLYEGVPLKRHSIAKAEAAGQAAPRETAKLQPNWWVSDPLVMAPLKPREDAERLVKAFLPRAFRRPVSDDLQQYYVKIAHGVLDKGLSFTDALSAAYEAALCSPHFLFLTELIDEAKGQRRASLDDYAIATRLSYFLWSSMPDDELFKAAAKGGLSKPEVLREQFERMLMHPNASRFTDNFAGQWFDLRNLDATAPDRILYGEFDEYLFWSMPRETNLFFEEILRGDLPLTEFVHSDWTFLNERLAQHYGIPGVAGAELRRVKLPAESHRGGVLGHASILKVTADGTRTSPIVRGKWVLDKIVGLPPAPPPPGVPSVEPDIRGATTIRHQLDKHRNTATCAACHQHIDPPGFALESFDAIGGWRDYYRASTSTFPRVEVKNYPGRTTRRGPAVEQGGQTPDGKAFRDLDEYKRILLSDKDQLTRNVAQKLLVYATGADLQFADREVVEQLVAKSRDKDYRFRSLLHDVVETRMFLNK